MTTQIYQAIAFALDGEYIVEGEYESIDEAWSTINDWGSRWVIYPIVGVIKNKTCVSMCDGFEHLNHKRITTVSTIINKYHEGK